METNSEIYAYTVIHSAAEFFKDKVPYLVALVNDGEQTVFTRIEGYTEGSEVHIGMEVELSSIENSIPIYRLKGL